jgi:hypothetical protein
MRVVALLLLIWSGSVLAVQAGGIDRTFTEKGDVTGDGRIETLTVHIVGDSMRSPFKWSVTITNEEGGVLYRVDRDDASQDAFFRTDGYEQGCTGYESCKSRYYFQDIPKAVFSCLNPSSSAWTLDEYRSLNLQNTASAYLTKHGVSQSNIKAAIAEMRDELEKPGFHAVAVPLSAVQTDAPMIWVPGVQMFVPFYQD